MAPKQKPCKISAVKPTAEELAAAKAVLAETDGKAFKSKMASMVNFRRANPDDTVEQSRGEERKEFLAKYLVHQFRMKNATKTETNKMTTSSNQEKMMELHWWSAEKMDQEMGPKKAKHWRDSKRLRWRPDSVTGSTLDDFKEWGVPQDWERLAEADFNAMELIVDAEANEESFATYASAKTFASPTAESSTGT